MGVLASVRSRIQRQSTCCLGHRKQTAGVNGEQALPSSAPCTAPGQQQRRPPCYDELQMPALEQGQPRQNFADHHFRPCQVAPSPAAPSRHLLLRSASERHHRASCRVNKHLVALVSTVSEREVRCSAALSPALYARSSAFPRQNDLLPFVCLGLREQWIQTCKTADTAKGVGHCVHLINRRPCMAKCPPNKLNAGIYWNRVCKDPFMHVGTHLPPSASFR